MASHSHWRKRRCAAAASTAPRSAARSSAVTAGPSDRGASSAGRICAPRPGFRARPGFCARLACCARRGAPRARCFPSPAIAPPPPPGLRAGAHPLRGPAPALGARCSRWPPGRAGRQGRGWIGEVGLGRFGLGLGRKGARDGRALEEGPARRLRKSTLAKMASGPARRPSRARPGPARPGAARAPLSVPRPPPRTPLGRGPAPTPQSAAAAGAYRFGGGSTLSKSLRMSSTVRKSAALAGKARSSAGPMPL